MKKIRIHNRGQSHTITIPFLNGPNMTIMALLLNHGHNIPTPCAGNGTCGKCVVNTSQGIVLACQTHVTDGMEIYLESSNEGTMAINDTYETVRPFTSNRDNGYGIAIDIGTTTLALELINMATGKRVCTFSAANSQRKLGADVITRIKQATQGAASKMHAYILEDIRQCIAQIIKKSAVQANSINFVAIAGNTTMLHLLQNLPCNTLGVYPFTPVSLTKINCNFADVFGGGLLSSQLIILPGISTFVGADITAGILCCNYPYNKAPSLLIDLGTNGEMALFTHDRILVTSTAAGPAFEAGNISRGTACIPGAISKVSHLAENNVFIYETIENAPPVGICGTGVLDIAAELVRHNHVDETGAFVTGDSAVITKGITFTQKDMREIQLAKSAVRSGIEILLDTGGYRYNDIGNVYLAGGFGHKINIENAAMLGLIPPMIKSKVIAVGNIALGGAAHVLLNKAAEADAANIANSAVEINLSTHPCFNDLFMEYMMF